MKLIKGIIKQLILEGVEDDYKRKLLNDNPYLEMNEINYYVTEFNKIKNNLPFDRRDITKYDWDKLERVVDSNQSIERIEKTIDINVDDSDVIYNQNNLKILKANTKKACVKYGTGYGFCISSRGEGNQYYNYRYGLKYSTGSYWKPQTIYFVIDEDKSKEMKSKNPVKFVDPTHMLVIMVSSNNQNKLIYKVTTADNEDVEDTQNIFSWDEIVKMQPKLNGKESLFKILDYDKTEKPIVDTIASYQDILDQKISDIYEVVEDDDTSQWYGLMPDYGKKGLMYRLFYEGEPIVFHVYDIDSLLKVFKGIKKLKEIQVNNNIKFFKVNYDNSYEEESIIVMNPNSKSVDLINFIKENKSSLVGDSYGDNPIVKDNGIILETHVYDASLLNDSNINKLSTPIGREEMLQSGVISLDNEDEEVYFNLFYKFVSEVALGYLNKLNKARANT
jgi:hypothetical protein